MTYHNNTGINTMKSRRGEFLLKTIHIFNSVLLITIAVAVFVGTLLIQFDVMLVKSYLEFHVLKPLLLLVFGSVLLIGAGCLGLLSAIHNWRTGIKTFAFFILCLLILMISLSVVFYFTLQTTNDFMRSRLILHIENYSRFWRDIDSVQLSLSCCGVDGFTDWNHTLNFIPGSCCKSNASCSATDFVDLHGNGCYSAIKTVVDYCIQSLIIVLATLSSIEIISIVLSLCYIRSLRKKKHEETKMIGNYIDITSIQIPRVNSCLEQTLYSNSPSVFEKNPKDKYNSPIYSCARRPTERNFSINYENPHEVYVKSPPKRRYDRRIFQSSPKRINNYYTDK